MKKITDEIYLRTLQPDEENYWREVFFDSVRSHFTVLKLPDEQLNLLLEQQFQAQNSAYRANHPQASNEIILFRDVPAGRVIYTTEHQRLSIVDMSVSSKFRGRGIGTKILEWFIEQSRSSGLPIRFYVEKSNPAQKLYERLGFEVKADIVSHFEMEWRVSEQSEMRQSVIE